MQPIWGLTPEQWLLVIFGIVAFFAMRRAE
jgi:hypothetical protein